MTSNIQRRVALSGAALLVAASYVYSSVANRAIIPFGNIIPDKYDIRFGTSNTLILALSSVGCPFCMKWEREYLSAFISNYVSTGKVSLLMRDSPRNGNALKAAAFLTAFDNIDERLRVRLLLADDISYMKTINSPTAAEGLRRINDTDFMYKIAKFYADDIERFHIVGTPSFLREGMPLLTGAYKPEEIFRYLDMALR